MELGTIFARITDEYAEKILNWALRKTGNRPDGEDLAQEIMLQVLSAVSKHRIEKLENFIWKTARYVWCNHLRALKRRSASELCDVLPDGADLAGDYAEKDALETELSLMRRRISELSRTQREIVILHYLDGISAKEIALRLNLSENAVNWHLFDSRNRIRKEFYAMDEKSAVYRPGKLRLTCAGEAPAYPDTEKVNDSLIRQNICLLCRPDGKTADELARATGIPKPYLEYDLDWLTEHEFLVLEEKKYYTAFVILDQRYFENRIGVYRGSKKEVTDLICGELRKNESFIRSIGFYGCEFPFEKLYWPLIMLFTSYCSRNNELMLRLKVPDIRSVRPDGGRYYVSGSDRSDGAGAGFSHLEPRGWNDFFGIVSDNCGIRGEKESYFWLGMYNFADRQYHPDIVTADRETQKSIHKVYCAVLEKDFSVSALAEDEKEILAKAVASNLIEKSGDSYKPNFVVFTSEELDALRGKIFAPLLDRLTPQIKKLGDKFYGLYKKDFPRAAECGIEWHTYVNLWFLGIYSLMLAAGDGLVYLPEDPRNGVALTLALVR